MAKKRWELWVLTAVAIFCGVISLFIPPKGVIDASVLQFIGLLAVFGALYTLPDAIKAGVTLKATTKAGTIEVGKKSKTDKTSSSNDNSDPQ